MNRVYLRQRLCYLYKHFVHEFEQFMHFLLASVIWSIVFLQEVITKNLLDGIFIRTMLYRLWKCDPHVIKMMLEIVISVIESLSLYYHAIIQFITTAQDWITLVLQILGLFAVYGIFSMWHVYLATEIICNMFQDKNYLSYQWPKGTGINLYSYYETKRAGKTWK